MRIALLQARRYEQDYLLRPDDKLPQRHAAGIADAERAMNALTEALAEHPSERHQMGEARRDMLAYVETFDSVQNDAQMVGINETQGLRGQLRTSVHEVEARLDTLDLPAAKIAMLMIRQHEKDFMLRLDPKNGDMIRRRLQEFLAGLDAANLPSETREALVQRMTAGSCAEPSCRPPTRQKLNTIFDTMERRLEALDADLAMRSSRQSSNRSNAPITC